MLRLNGKEIQVTIFPDHTSQVWKLPEELLKASVHLIEWDFEAEREFLQLAQLKALLDQRKVLTDLRLSYLPYGRQDKPVANDATFALVPFARLLNSLAFNTVEIVDPHSAKALELIDRSRALYPTELVQKIKGDLQIDVLCYPDKGARSRYSAIYAGESLFGEKVRDQLTGQILSYDLQGSAEGKRVLIVEAEDGRELVIFNGKVAQEFPKNSLFSNLDEASNFFARGSIGYSLSRDKTHFQGMELRLLEWGIRPMEIISAFAELYHDEAVFPKNSTHLDSAMLMENLRHEWHKIPEIPLVRA